MMKSEEKKQAKPHLRSAGHEVDGYRVFIREVNGRFLDEVYFDAERRMHILPKSAQVVDLDSARDGRLRAPRFGLGAATGNRAESSFEKVALLRPSSESSSSARRDASKMERDRRRWRNEAKLASDRIQMRKQKPGRNREDFLAAKNEARRITDFLLEELNSLSLSRSNEALEEERRHDVDWISGKLLRFVGLVMGERWSAIRETILEAHGGRQHFSPEVEESFAFREAKDEEYRRQQMSSSSAASGTKQHGMPKGAGQARALGWSCYVQNGENVCVSPDGKHRLVFPVQVKERREPKRTRASEARKKSNKKSKRGK